MSDIEDDWCHLLDSYYGPCGMRYLLTPEKYQRALETGLWAPAAPPPHKAP